MAAALGRQLGGLRLAAIGNLRRSIVTRSFSSSTGENLSKNWISKLLVRKIEPTKESHSRILSDKEIIFALYTHNVQPSSVDKYLVNYEETVNFINSKLSNEHLELIGSWTVEGGDLDQVIHLWQYTGGYKCVDDAQQMLSQDKDYQKLFKEQGSYLRSRYLQYFLPFSYWPAITKREGGNKYELRSYTLEPGTMIEWGNNWAKAINFRRSNNEAFAGYFSQIGRLYNVHHIWCYKDLQTRKETRESAWRVPGWDECVAHTVPLILGGENRIMNPTSFSPTK